jgi:hypothetical protein
MTQLFPEISTAVRAHQVIALTASAWLITPRAKHRSLPARMLKRLHMSAPTSSSARPLLAHSW